MSSWILSVLYYYVIYAAIPIFTLSTLLAFIVFKISKKFRRKKKQSFAPFLLLPIFLTVISIFFIGPIMGVYEDASSFQKRNEQNLRAHEVNSNSVKKGTLTKSKDNYVYTCNECGYSIVIPHGWGLIEYGDTVSITTPEYNPGKSHLETLKGSAFNIELSTTNFFQEQHESYKKQQSSQFFFPLETRTINGIEYDIFYVSSALPLKFAEVYTNKNPNILITATYGNEKDLEENLDIFLNNLTIQN